MGEEGFPTGQGDFSHTTVRGGHRGLSAAPAHVEGTSHTQVCVARQGRPGSWVSWTITQPVLLPEKAWLLPHLSNLFHHPYTCFSPPTLRLGSCVLGHLPLPVFSFSIPL